MNCPKCNGQTRFVQHMNSYYCDNCQSYTGQQPTAQTYSGQPPAPNYTPQQQYPPPPPQQAPAKSKDTIPDKLGGIPLLFIVGFIVGLINAFLGVLVVVVLAIIMWTQKNPGKSVVPKQDGMPRFMTALMGMVGKMLVVMMLSLPVAGAGLIMANFRNPNTFIKYVSVMIVDPSNFTFTTGMFPGMPLLMLIGIVLIFMGLILPERIMEKKFKQLIQLAGMIVITITPIISFYLFPNLGTFDWGYGIFYYLGWIGFVLQILAPMIGKASAPSQPQNQGYASYALLAMFTIPVLASISEPSTTVATGAAITFFEIGHHSIASLIGGLIGGVGGPPMAEEMLEPKTTILELTYPAGRSPNVFTTGWLFGARAIINVGGEDEQDVSHLVKWSGSGSFSPAVGNRSRPSLGLGGNNIILEIEVGETHVRKTFHVNAVSNSLHAAVGDLAEVPADSHGCPACPHTCVGPIASGSPHVLINGRPAARVGDGGNHASCCGPNTFTIIGSTSSVIIDGRRAVKKGDTTQHCGGTGFIIQGAP